MPLPRTADEIPPVGNLAGDDALPGTRPQTRARPLPSSAAKLPARWRRRSTARPRRQCYRLRPHKWRGRPIPRAFLFCAPDPAMRVTLRKRLALAPYLIAALKRFQGLIPRRQNYASQDRQRHQAARLYAVDLGRHHARPGLHGFLTAASSLLPPYSLGPRDNVSHGEPRSAGPPFRRHLRPFHFFRYSAKISERAN